MRYIVLVWVFLLSASWLYGETVMVYVENSIDRNAEENIEENADEDEELSLNYYRSAIEAGIIDVFFEAGHIAYNLLPDLDARVETNGDSRLWLRIMAANGGASHVVWARFDFDPEQDIKSETAVVTYGFVDIAIPDELLGGTIAAADLELTNSDPARLCFEIGQAIAARALKTNWQGR